MILITEGLLEASAPEAFGIQYPEEECPLQANPSLEDRRCHRKAS